jgi:ectoine hydroxylase-related dioxygenase (phytanoyl-CoA dioxygenase family)
MAALTRQQTAFFDAFGFVRLEAVFVGEINEIAEALKALPSSTVAPNVVDRHPRLAQLPQDDRIIGVARSVLGDDVEWTQISADPDVCGRARHDDTSDGSGRRQIVVSLVLRPVRADSDAIRVIPGTHHAKSSYARDLRRLLSESEEPGKAFDVECNAIPATVVAADPGDALVWDSDLIHATSDGVSQRRLLSVGFIGRSR